MFPKLLCIDGTDGSGKATTVAAIKKVLEERGERLTVVDPPFYEENSGKMVTEYLTGGYGDWRDRSISSMLYSVDRNMFYRTHFDEIFKSGKYDTVLYDRNWLSNIFFQTTLVAHDLETTRRLYDTGAEYDVANMERGTERAPIKVPMSIIRDTLTKYRPYDGEYVSIVSYPETLKQYADEIGKIYQLPIEVQNDILYRYMKSRGEMVLETIRNVARMEISCYSEDRLPLGSYFRPCGTPFPKTPNFVFDAPKVVNIALIPHYKNASKIIGRNLKKRYHGDIADADKNESNTIYQQAVIENIEWIHRYGSYIYDTNQYHSGYLAQLKKAFGFHIVYVDTDDGMMKTTDELVAKILEIYDQDDGAEKEKANE